MKGFSGFPSGKQRLTSIPNLFFSDLLPLIDDLVELKVTIYAFWALSQQDGAVRFMRLTDFLNDTIFINGLGPTASLASQALIDGLERAVSRGTFLHIEVEGADGHMDLYFLNSERGRAAVEGITKGEWRPWPDENEPVSLLVERPNIFVLYEQNIGALTPIIADELRDAEKNYAIRWIEDAIKIAVENNVRRWNYVLAILEKWREQGRQEQDGISRRDTQKQLRGQIPKEYEDIVKR